MDHENSQLYQIHGMSANIQLLYRLHCDNVSVQRNQKFSNVVAHKTWLYTDRQENCSFQDDAKLELKSLYMFKLLISLYKTEQRGKFNWIINTPRFLKSHQSTDWCFKPGSTESPWNPSSTSACATFAAHCMQDSAYTGVCIFINLKFLK